MEDVFLPPGWPEAAKPPGSEHFESSAVAFLLEHIPEYRQASDGPPCSLLILASIARHAIAGTVEGARQGYRTARTELGEAVPPHAVDATLPRLSGMRGVGLRLTAKAVGPNRARPARREVHPVALTGAVP